MGRWFHASSEGIRPIAEDTCSAKECAREGGLTQLLVPQLKSQA